MTPWRPRVQTLTSKEIPHTNNEWPRVQKKIKTFEKKPVFNVCILFRNAVAAEDDHRPLAHHAVAEELPLLRELELALPTLALPEIQFVLKV